MGAPAEEDLKNWGQHTGSTSVPDEIMQRVGEDLPGAVSFIFTCQVGASNCIIGQGFADQKGCWLQTFGAILCDVDSWRSAVSTIQSEQVEYAKAPEDHLPIKCYTGGHANGILPVDVLYDLQVYK